MTLLARALAACVLVAALAAKATAAEPEGFRYDGVTHAGASLPTALRQRLHEVDLEAAERKRREIESFVVDRYVTERALLDNRPIDEIRKELIFGEPPDEATLQTFYEDNKARIGAPFDAIRDQLRQFLAQRIAEENIKALLARIAVEKDFFALVNEPDAPVFEIATEGYPAKGGEAPLATLVEFADFQCPYCKAAMPAIEAMIAKYGDRLRVVYRDLPVNPSGVSREVAKGGVCADAQGAFWPYHDLAFARQAELTKETPTALAAELGLDAEAFAACLEDPATGGRVVASEREALELGVSGTPAFFVNGRRVRVGEAVEADLAAAIDAALLR